MKKGKIPTIIGIVILLFGIFAGVMLLKNRQIFRIGASQEASPKDVRITNITDSSFSVSWTTSKETTGFVKWGKSQGNLDTAETDTISEKGFTHYVNVRSLNPETTYYFKINSDSYDFDNQGTSWQVVTGSYISDSPEGTVVSGTVVDASQKPVGNSLVYITVGGGSMLSTTTSEQGSFILPISTARNKNLTSFININEKTTLVEISINAGPQGVASAQVFPQSAKPMPNIILGKVSDFKNLPASKNEDSPNAKVEVMETEGNQESGFEVSQTALPQTQSITLDSIDEGEIVSTTDPEFFGKGPAKTSFEVTIESTNPQTDSITTLSNGTWKWSPEESLTEGNHKITIKWKDATGILRTISRNFYVKAAESPAFVSTPSATVKATKTPISTSSATPKATKTATASALPKQPVSGGLTETLAMFMMVIGSFAFSVFAYRKSLK